MATDRKLRIIYVSNYYDGPLAGLAYYKSNLVYFSLRHEAAGRLYNIHRLTAIQKVLRLIDKKLFELCVSRSWSYDRRKGFPTTRKNERFIKLRSYLFYNIFKPILAKLLIQGKVIAVVDGRKLSYA